MRRFALAFDYDGVIVESNEVKQRAFLDLFADQPAQIRELIQRYEITNRPKSRFEKLEYIARCILNLGDAEVSSFVRKGAEEYSRLTLERVISSPSVLGAIELLKRYSKKVPLYVVSATPLEDLTKVLRARGEFDYFARVFGAPAVKSEILSELHSVHPGLVFIGDSLSDYAAAVISGASFIGRQAIDHFPDGTLVFPDLNGVADHLSRKELGLV